MSSAARKHADSKGIARQRLVLIGCFALLTAGLLSSLSYLWLSHGDDTTAVGTTVVGHGTGGGVLANSAGSFTIKGDAAGLISPGVTEPLDLLLTNPWGVPLSVTGLRVTVRRVSAPNADDAHPCVVGDFSVEQASGSLEINLPARATRALSSLGVARASLPAVGMLRRSVNQDGCKGASLTFGYAASGTVSP
jgi:hypothetical protein